MPQVQIQTMHNYVLRLLLLVAFSFLSGCGGSSDGNGSAPNPNPETVPETVSVTVPAVNAEARGSSRVNGIALSNGIGTFEINGQSVPSIAYYKTEWPEIDYTIFHIASPQESTLNIEYIYCRGNSIEWIWHEDYHVPLEAEQASGEFQSNGTYTASNPDLIRLKSPPPAESLVAGVDIDGQSISYHGDGPGWIKIDNNRYDLYPFEYVDCSECNSSSDNGWLELHSIISDSYARFCFGILYLRPESKSNVSLSYIICFDPVETVSPQYFDAQWTVDSSISAMHIRRFSGRSNAIDRMLRPEPPAFREVPPSNLH